MHSVDFVSSVVYNYIASHALQHINRRSTQELVWSHCVSKGTMVKSSNGTNISKVATYLWSKHFVDICSNFREFSSASSSKIKEPCNLLCKSNTSCTVNASIHVSDDYRAEVLILYSPFEFMISRCFISIIMREVLKIALTTLITNRTVERMVS